MTPDFTFMYTAVSFQKSNNFIQVHGIARFY